MTITLHLPTGQATPDRWWTCPTWCAGGDDCYGGDTFTFGDRTVVTNRMHQGALVDLISDPQDGSAPQRVRLIAERCDSPDTPGKPSLVLHVEAVDRPENLTDADIAAHLDGIDRPSRDNLLAHHLAGTWATQSAWISPQLAAALITALTGGVA